MEIINNNVFDDETFTKEMLKQDAVPSTTDESEDNLKAAEVVTNFVPMSLEERVLEKVVYRDEQAIEDMKERILLCRKFLVTLSKKK